MSVTAVTVTRTLRLSPGMVRVTVTGPTLGEYRSTGVGDEYVRVHFPEADGTLPEPREREDGNWDFGEDPYPHVQPYTIRAHRPEQAEMDLDFVLHGHGRAAAWAGSAVPGERLLFGEPRALFEPPARADRFVFATDATGLPALGRLLEQLAPGDRAHAIVEIAEAGHEIPLNSPGEVTVRWLPGRGNGIAPSALTEALRESLVDQLGDTGYVWVAGESKELRLARKLLRHELGLPAEQYRVIGYWTDKAEAWVASYEALDEGTRAGLAAIWAETDDEELGRDRYERRLESLGL